MAGKRKAPAAEGHTGTIAARHAAEAERVAAANKAKADLIAETKAAQAETAKRLKNKPTDTRTIAPVDPAA